jgi:hypothetical protein
MSASSTVLIQINRHQRAGVQIIGDDEYRLVDHGRACDRGGPQRVAIGARIA